MARSTEGESPMATLHQAEAKEKVRSLGTHVEAKPTMSTRVKKPNKWKQQMTQLTMRPSKPLTMKMTTSLTNLGL